MKILVIGDFHGKLLRKFNALINKEKIDLVISLGDYPPFKYRKLWFKYCYGHERELWEVIGKKRYKKIVDGDLREAENAIKKLNSLPVPVYTVLGNIDHPDPNDIIDAKPPEWDWDRKRDYAVSDMIKKYKNIHRIDYKALKFGDYIFIGMRGHSSPGSVKSRAYKKHRKILDNLFRRFKKENRGNKIIFVSHNIAYNTKLDELSLKAVKFAAKSAGERIKEIKKRKRHYGSKLARRIINTYHPLLHLGGHVHESAGKDKIGRTTLINPGAAHEGKGAIITLSDKGRGKVTNVKFIK